MVHLYLCLPDRRGQKIHKSKGDGQCKIGQKENVCLFCSYVFSVRTSQADRGINSPLEYVHTFPCIQLACRLQNIRRNETEIICFLTSVCYGMLPHLGNIRRKP